MNKRTLKNAAIYTGAFLLFAVVAIAQSKPVSKDDSAQNANTTRATAREASSGMATGRRQYKPLSTREASTGMATGMAAPHEPVSGQDADRKHGQVQTADFNRTEVATSRQSGGPIIDEVSAQAQTSNQAPATGSLKSLGSAHATESIDRAPAPGKNELDQLNTQDATKDKTSTNPMYKDHGTSGTNPLYEPKDKTAAAPSHSHETVEYKDPEDMTTRYRPGNNKTTKTSGKPQAAGTQSH